MSYLFPARAITFDAAMRDLSRGSPKARTIAANALGDVTDPAERARAIDALLAALDDDKAEVRGEACSSLAQLAQNAAPENVVAALAKRLTDGMAGVRQSAAIALGTIRHAAGFTPLADALRDGPPELRFQAVTSLVEIDAQRAYEPALAALADRDSQVAAAAALSLGAIGNHAALPALVARFGELTDAGARFDVAYALAELGDPTGRPALVAALVDLDRAWDAAEALGWLAGPEDVAALAGCLRAKKTPIEASVLAAGLLVKLRASAHEDAARKLLLEALGNRKIHVRGIAVDQLAAAGGAWALAPLDKLARSGKGDVLRESIAAAVKQIRAREVT